MRERAAEMRIVTRNHSRETLIDTEVYDRLFTGITKFYRSPSRTTTRMPAGERRQESDTGRGVSPAIGVILAAAIAIILAAVVGAFVLGVGDSTDEPAPSMSVDFDRESIDKNVAGNTGISILHEGGNTVPVSELRIITETQCFDPSGGAYTTDTSRGALTNLPVDGTGGIDNDTNVRGDRIFDTYGPTTPAPLSGNDEAWKSGEQLKFQIANDRCSVLEEAETDVELIHEPSNSRIAEESFGSGNLNVVSPADAEFSFDMNEVYGSSDSDAFLNVSVTKGVFRPEDLDMTVEVDDGSNKESATSNMKIFDGSDFFDSSPEEFSNQNFVGPGDKLVVDLESKASGSGPSGFGPLNDATGGPNGGDTDITVTVTFNGNEVVSTNLVAEGFEVNP